MTLFLIKSKRYREKFAASFASSKKNRFAYSMRCCRF